MGKEENMNYWLKSSEEEFKTMIVMKENNRNTWALFIGHLMLEKLLKVIYVKNNGKQAPFIHNLLRLAEKSNIKLSEDRKVKLATITAFNINTRYDDYKMSFHKQCTNEYTDLWIDNIKEIRKWILEQINK
jgi:HEPN domain-containing protein